MPSSTPMSPSDIRPPRLRHSMMELGRAMLEIGSTAMLGPVFKTLPKGDGHTIITIPGFMGADGSTSQLRRFLRNRGYNAVPWGLGRNGADVRPGSIWTISWHQRSANWKTLIAAARRSRSITPAGRK